MGFSTMHRLVNGGAVVLALVSLSSPGFSARPCTCDDIAAISNVLDQTLRSEAAWDRICYQIATEAAKAPKNDTEAVAQFKNEVWPPGKAQPKDVGGLDPQGEPTASPEAEKQYCEIVFDSIKKVHEQEHRNFYLHKYFWVSLTSFSDHQAMWVHALSESEAYEAQGWYLIKKLSELKKKCSSKAELATSPDEEHQQYKKASQRHRIAKAATRVAAYAKTIS